MELNEFISEFLLFFQRLQNRVNRFHLLEGLRPELNVILFDFLAHNQFEFPYLTSDSVYLQLNPLLIQSCEFNCAELLLHLQTYLSQCLLYLRGYYWVAKLSDRSSRELFSFSPLAIQSGAYSYCAFISNKIIIYEIHKDNTLFKLYTLPFPKVFGNFG